MTLGDEQLAMMLQNEMFREQAQARLGSNFMGESRASSSGEQLDVMKSLSEMGEGMKRQLNYLASQFTRRGNTQYSQLSQQDAERNPLIGRNGEVMTFSKLME